MYVARVQTVRVFHEPQEWKLCKRQKFHQGGDGYRRDTDFRLIVILDRKTLVSGQTLPKDREVRKGCVRARGR